MNFMRSLCCLFSNRCGCDAGEERKPQTDTSNAVPSDADIAPEKLPRRATHETNNSNGGETVPKL
jgi:hypothetical protein